MRYAMGAQYALSESLILGGYVNYIDMDDIEIEAQRFGGKYTDNNVTQLMANMIWKF